MHRQERITPMWFRTHDTQLGFECSNHIAYSTRSYVHFHTISCYTSIKFHTSAPYIFHTMLYLHCIVPPGSSTLFAWCIQHKTSPFARGYSQVGRRVCKFRPSFPELRVCLQEAVFAPIILTRSVKGSFTNSVC